MKALQKKHGAYLPHWTRDGSIYHVTFRLADSLPANILAAWQAERERHFQRVIIHRGKISAGEVRRVDQLHAQRIENYLDSGQGDCLLTQPAVAEILQSILLRFHAKRYRIAAWCIMPNHVHAVVQPQDQYKLPDILHGWKYFSARQINRLLQRKGRLWQPEYYDHLLRNETELRLAVKYVLENPVNAKLNNWRWVGTEPVGPPLQDE